MKLSDRSVVQLYNKKSNLHLAISGNGEIISTLNEYNPNSKSTKQIHQYTIINFVCVRITFVKFNGGKSCIFVARVIVTIIFFRKLCLFLHFSHTYITSKIAKLQKHF